MPDDCPNSKHGKPYIFGKRKTSPFQKYVVFHGYYEDIHLGVFSISAIFSSTLVPFSQIRNHHDNESYTYINTVSVSGHCHTETIKVLSILFMNSFFH